jgi:hypothetical protein
LSETRERCRISSNNSGWLAASKHLDRGLAGGCFDDQEA